MAEVISMDPRISNPRTSTVATFALIALVGGSALAVGTVHLPVILCVSAVAIVSTSVVLFLDRTRLDRLASPALVLVGLSAWCVIQAIPLPLGFLSAIAPHNADVWARSLRP